MCLKIKKGLMWIQAFTIIIPKTGQRRCPVSQLWLNDKKRLEVGPAFKDKIPKTGLRSSPVSQLWLNDKKRPDVDSGLYNYNTEDRTAQMPGQSTMCLKIKKGLMWIQAFTIIIPKTGLRSSPVSQLWLNDKKRLEVVPAFKDKNTEDRPAKQPGQSTMCLKIKKGLMWIQAFTIIIPKTGLEPVQLIQPGDFKSPVSTNSTTSA